MFFKRLCRTTLLFFISSPLAFAAEHGVHVYRYQIEHRDNVYEFREEVAGDVPKSGRVYEVEYDSAGRQARETDYLDGVALSTTKVHYLGDSALFDTFEISSAGSVTSIEKYQRDSTGKPVRVDRFTVAGLLTDSVVYETLGDCVGKRFLDAQGTLTARIVDCYSASGALVQSTRAVRDTKTEYIEEDFDPDTGRHLEHKQFHNGKLGSSSVFSYRDNDETRADFYDANGKWLGSDEKRADLLLNRKFALPSGSTKEITFVYDEHYVPQKATVTVDATLVCTLVFETKPDGAVLRTLVRGPDGSLWAEYPTPIIGDVGRQGQAPMRSDGIIYHKGDWW